MKKLYWSVAVILIFLIAFINMLAWNVAGFSDWYIETIFPVWGLTYGRLMELSPVSVGEIMLLCAVIIVAVWAVVLLLSLFSKKHRRLALRYTGGVFMLALVIGLVMTLNCFVLYHSSTFADKYLSAYIFEEREYSVSELGELRDIVVSKANELSRQVERDEDGRIVYDKDIETEAIRAMEALGEEYPQLDGHYTRAKAFASSEFFSQQYMEGYYFPFSMEANYNDVMYIVNKPAAICHELAHTKGFIYEDEANMIAFLACIHSDDPLFQYSGYLSVLNYIDKDFRKSVGDDPEVIAAHVRVSGMVRRDNVFLTPEAWEKVEKKAVISTKTVKKVSDDFLNANLNLNGIEEGTAMYGEVVGLMMDYYMCNIDEVLSRDVYLASRD
ncbi:MAG: DUF3810 domain-containing protein [Lachnospiraceae bacterium]|nr:DUF3810 domain-containing protein [Lachnospiraceae bacterium]